MDFSPHLAQLDLLHTGNHNAIVQQTYGLHGVDGVFALTLQAQRSGRLGTTTQNHTLHPLSPLLQLGHMQHDAAFAGNNSQSALAFTTAAGPASPMGPPNRPRKRKAATLRADDWEPYKKRILDLHIKQKKPLPEVRQTIEKEYSFKAEYVASLEQGRLNPQRGADTDAFTGFDSTDHASASGEMIRTLSRRRCRRSCESVRGGSLSRLTRASSCSRCEAAR
jgi:hypothetical protein